MYDLFNEMIKRFTRSYKYEVEQAVKKIKEIEKDNEIWKRELNSIPAIIKRNEIKIKEQEENIKEAKRKLEVIKEMHLCC